MPEKRPSDWRDQWNLLQQESVTLTAEAEALQGLPADDPRVEAQEGALAALDVKKDAIAHAAWLTTARNQADVLLLAEIAWDYSWGLAGVATFPTLPADIDDRLQREVAIAYLVRGVFTASQAIADGDRPHMPHLTDKDLDDLYAFAGDAETGARCLLHTLNSVFYKYRLAAFDWDHARGLLSAEELDGADAETESRREQARARARGQTRAYPGQAPQGAGSLSLPEVEDLVDRAKAGVGALRTLWDLHPDSTSPLRSPRPPHRWTSASTASRLCSTRCTNGSLPQPRPADPSHRLEAPRWRFLRPHTPTPILEPSGVPP
jgi:hypothetical protein